MTSVHGAIKFLPQENILISNSGDAMISDFGLSDIRGSGCGDLNGLRSARYQAPELIFGEAQQATLACDVYSFSVVCYEV